MASTVDIITLDNLETKMSPTVGPDYLYALVDMGRCVFA